MSESEITPYNKIDKPLVVYRFSGNFIVLTYFIAKFYIAIGLGHKFSQP